MVGYLKLVGTLKTGRWKPLMMVNGCLSFTGCSSLRVMTMSKVVEILSPGKSVVPLPPSLAGGGKSRDLSQLVYGVYTRGVS